jgi:hypothetical protein
MVKSGMLVMPYWYLCFFVHHKSFRGKLKMLIVWSQYDVSEFKLRTVVLLRQLFTNRALYVSLRQSRGFLVIIILSYRSYCFRLAILKNCSFDIKQYYLLIHSFNFHGLTENLIFLDTLRFDSVILM